MMEYRVAASLILLTYASYRDLKTREIGDRPWVAFSLIGVTLSAYEFLSGGGGFDPLLTILSVAVTTPIALGIYYAGLYGGADAKALITLSFLLPIYRPPLYIHPIAPLIAFTNSTFLVLILPAAFFTRNTLRVLRGEDIFSGFEGEPLWKKVLVSFLGYRLRPEDRRRFYFVLEKIVEGRRRFDLSLLKYEPEELHGSEVWGTPGIPLIVFIAGGFIAMLIIGDFVALILRSTLFYLI